MVEHRSSESRVHEWMKENGAYMITSNLQVRDKAM